MPRPRWPRRVYANGEEPDYRFSFANERTSGAWIRTALALLAGGGGLDAITLPLPDRLQQVLAALLVFLGMLCAVASWLRWAVAERAMRRTASLPALRLGMVVAATVTATALAVTVAAM